MTDQMTEQAGVEALIAVMEQYAREHQLPGQLPEGIRLEMHPHVHYMIMRSWVPDYGDFVSDNQIGPFKRVNIPVKINLDLPDYTWRLVVITEDVINGGVMPHDPRG